MKKTIKNMIFKILHLILKYINKLKIIFRKIKINKINLK